jgi:hypothetical protein
MTTELSTKSTAKIIVNIKTNFSTPLSDLYMLKELLTPDASPDPLDWIRISKVKKTAITIWLILLIINRFIF